MTTTSSTARNHGANNLMGRTAVDATQTAGELASFVHSVPEPAEYPVRPMDPLLAD